MNHTYTRTYDGTGSHAGGSPIQYRERERETAIQKYIHKYIHTDTHIDAITHDGTSSHAGASARGKNAKIHAYIHT